MGAWGALLLEVVEDLPSAAARELPLIPCRAREPVAVVRALALPLLLLPPDAVVEEP
jgi:hypothetical protein